MAKKKTKKQDLEIDVLSHEYVPKMEVVAQKEKLLEKLNLEEFQLPKVKSTDPAVMALGAQSGDVIRIHRKDPTASYLYYRLVI